jgi:inhibitor of KinA
MKLIHAGDSCIILKLSDELSPAANDLVLEISTALSEGGPRGIVEISPAYSSIGVYYDPTIIEPKEVEEWIKVSQTRKKPATSIRRDLYRIPVDYSDAYGPDLQEVAKETNLTAEEVVKLHTRTRYRVYMLGFMPGFLYLGDVPAPIRVPRLKKPRVRVPPGSVGLAKEQTGIYGIESPGGWKIIGRTPIRLLDTAKSPPTPFKTGDLVEFFPISSEEFSRLDGISVEQTKIG